MINDTSSMIQWGCDTLLSLGYKLRNHQPENVKDTPWSSVFRFQVSDGYVYLKQVPELIALEANVTELLHMQFHAPVSEVIAKNFQLNCFMMKDVGKPLRELLKQNFEVKILCKAIHDFTQMQASVSDHIDEFLGIGVPDWRLDKLPGLYDGLLSKECVLKSDGLLASEIDKLKLLHSKVAGLCNKLSSYGVKETIVQCDFHDNNIMINPASQKLTFIDLGEVVISHPFFSLIGCLYQAKRHHGVSAESEVFLRLEDACFKEYLCFGSRDKLSQAFEVASVLWMVYEALAQYRLRVACGKESDVSFQQKKLAVSLKGLIKVLEKIESY